MNELKSVLGAVQRMEFLTGARRYAVSAGFGAVMGLAYAPLRWPLAALIALSGLALLLEGSLSGAARHPRRSAFLVGTVFGGTFFAVSTSWLANAFLVQADQFAWMIPVVLPVFFAGMGLFYGLAALIHVDLRQRLPVEGMAKVLPLVIGLTVAEWLRGHILTGFPWNLHSQIMAASTLTLQPLAALGPYGYGVVAALMALLPAAALLAPRSAVRASFLFAGLTGAILAYGGFRLAASAPADREGVSVVVVQPNVAQRDKLDGAKMREALRRNLAVSTRAAASLGDGQDVYVIWPENAFPLLDRLVGLPGVLARDLPDRTYLVSGSIRRVEDGYANTLFVFGPAGGGGDLVATYDKHRLVPFGETLPFAGVFTALGLESLSPAGGGGFVPGSGPRTLAFGRAPFAPLICYEDVFPGTLYPDGERPDWLVVVTNDAWFGDAAGPEQHLDIARMRAVETGLPVIRSANTGISAVIDAEGRVLEELPLYEAGVISRPLPATGGATLFTLSGDLIAALMLSFIGATVFYRSRQR